MFKRIGLVLLALLLMSGVAQATTVLNSNIMDTDFNAVTVADNSTEVAIAGYDKIAFFVVYNETDSGSVVSGDITCQISYDGDTWQSANFNDYASPTTMVSSETLTADGSYYFWFNKDLVVPYVRVVATLTGTTETELCNVKIYIVAKE